MKTNKADIDVVKSKLNDIVELWCVLNTYKGDPRALKIMGLISEFIHKEVLLKRWNELHPLKKDPTESLYKIPFQDDPAYMAKRRVIIQRLLS